MSSSGHQRSCTFNLFYMPWSPPALQNVHIVSLNISRRIFRASPSSCVRLMKFRLSAHWNRERDDHDLQQHPSALVISELTLHGFLRKRQSEADKKKFEPFRWFIFHLFALSAVKNPQTQVSTTGKCFLNVMAPAHLIDLRSVCTKLCPAYEIYISKKAVLYFGLVIRLLSVNKNVSFQWAGNSKEIGFFFPLFLSDAHTAKQMSICGWRAWDERLTQLDEHKHVHQNTGVLVRLLLQLGSPPAWTTIGRNRWVSHTLKGNFCFQATGNCNDLCSCKGICEKSDKYPQETCFSAPPLSSLWDLLYFPHFCAFGCFLSNSKRHPLTKKSNRLRTLSFCFLACASAGERALFLSTFCTRLWWGTRGQKNNGAVWETSQSLSHP